MRAMSNEAKITTKEATANPLARALTHIFEREIIEVCDNEPLLLRWKVATRPTFQVYLHWFVRDDHEREMHSHPFDFVSIILWRGYVEERPTPRIRAILSTGDVAACDPSTPSERKRMVPGSILRRPAWWAHRVLLVDGKPSWSLVVRSAKKAEWGFFTKNGWIWWRDWCNIRICGEE